MPTLLIALVLLLAGATAAPAAVQGKEIDYRAGGTNLKGYLAHDDAQPGRHPGVLIVHEWWGLNDYARQRARMLAAAGYTALAVDMYGDGRTADHPEDAGRFSAAVMKNLPVARSRFLAALELLKAQPSVDPQRLAAIGYCFGGGVVLAMARDGVDLAGVVSFHGSLATATPAGPGVIKAKVLVCNGADDPFVTAAQIDAFRQEMDSAGVDYRFVNYPGALHSFTNPGADAVGKRFNLPLAYNAEADRKSWQTMLDFLTEIFSK